MEFKLKQYRKKAGYGQADVAKLLNVSRSTISMWECNVRLPDFQDIISLCAIFNIDIYEMFDIDPPERVNLPVYKSVARAVFDDGLPMYEVADEKLCKRETHIAFIVDDHSMKPVIQEGDIIIIHKGDIQDGEIAAVAIEKNCVMIRKIKYVSGGIILTPFNPEFDTQFFSEDDVEKLQVKILGKVVELRRRSF